MDSQNEPLVILYDAHNREWLHFEHPQRIVAAAKLDEIVPALEEIEGCVNRNGWHAAGFVSYEAAPAFESALVTRPPEAGFPLLWFGLYSGPRKTATPPAAHGEAAAGAWIPSLAQESYNDGIARIKERIARGETYQVNYTFRLGAEFTGSPWSFFVKMLDPQTPGYPAFIDTGRHVICCASPELFFRLEGQRVACRPMKGTAKRGRALDEDLAQAAWLHTSEKNRAENVMIVDMIRNDLGRVAETGSVHAPALFDIECYRTLWQMTSTVNANVRASFAEIFAALFPSASVTGAPKISTMKIIAELETTPRRAYTGAIGFLAPGRQAQFNVAIRTVVIDRDRAPTQRGQAEYGVGGGVVWDSTAGDEYAEALLKARVLGEQPPAFALLETLRWSRVEGYFLLDRHLKRLRDSAIYFGYPFDEGKVKTCLAHAINGLPNAPQRVRLLLDRQGQLSSEVFPLTVKAESKPLRVKLAAGPVHSDDVFLFHKTTRRETYEQARRDRPDCDDALLYNERGELTEATIANLVVELDGKLFTPPVSCGLLAGAFRAALLEQGIIVERILLPEDLARCTKLFLVNSVRGWMEAEWIR